MVVVMKRFCSHPGCNALVVQGACPNHKQVATQSLDYKTPEESKFYRSNRWRLLSERHRREQPLCQMCAKQGIVKAGSLTDHIITIRKGMDPYDESNLQTLCDYHHQKKRAGERGTAAKAGRDRKKIS